MNIIDELDKEGINLQETILNLKEQGYEYIWNDWIKLLWDLVIARKIGEICLKSIEGIK